MVLVVGAPNSSNSMRLVEVARNHGCERAMLVQRASDIDWDALGDVAVLGVTAGASAPDILIQEVLQGARDRFDATIEEVTLTREDVVFKLPRVLTATAAAE
jgi:4-hydroxy-3-methylbut-2-enyl diphosphate reductase